MTDKIKSKNQSAKTASALEFNNPDYWKKHRYEHSAEILAIRRLLTGKHFSKAVDLGGGYGRLSPVIKEFSDRVTLVVENKNQLDQSANLLQQDPSIMNREMKLNKLDFDDSSVDLVVMIKSTHHLIDPTKEFKEIRRILDDEGLAVIEIANFMHVRNRIKYLVRGKKMPLEPIDVRTRKMRQAGISTFVNHNPKTVMKQLAHAGLKVERILSVSNLSAPGLRKAMPEHVMLAIEGILQPALAKTYFGPSIFLLVRQAT